MTVEQLNIKYNLVDRRKDFEIIDFFDKNALAIQNLDENQDADTLTTKLCLLSDYSYALANSGQSSKAIPFLRDSIRLQERHPNFIENVKKSKNYEFLVFALGQAFHKTGNISQAKNEFEKLINLSPDNEAYKTWIVGTSNFRRNRIMKYVNVSFTAWLLIGVLFRNKLPKPVDVIFIGLGLTFFAVLITLGILNYLTKRKYR